MPESWTTIKDQLTTCERNMQTCVGKAVFLKNGPKIYFQIVSDFLISGGLGRLFFLLTSGHALSA